MQGGSYKPFKSVEVVKRYKDFLLTPRMGLFDWWRKKPPADITLQERVSISLAKSHAAAATVENERVQRAIEERAAFLDEVVTIKDVLTNTEIIGKLMNIDFADELKEASVDSDTAAKNIVSVAQLISDDIDPLVLTIRKLALQAKEHPALTTTDQQGKLLQYISEELENVLIQVQGYMSSLAKGTSSKGGLRGIVRGEDYSADRGRKESEVYHTMYRELKRAHDNLCAFKKYISA
jgi:hypothetical protein